MLRPLLISAVFLPFIALSGGCAEKCQPIDTITDVNYSSFANIVDYSGQVDPRGQTPLNGPVDFGFRWTGGATGAPVGGTGDPGQAVSVIMDGQEFAGTGSVDPDECGNFFASWAGTYLGNQTSHTFTAEGLFKFYDNRLDGEFTWGESWQDSQSGRVGGFEALLGLIQGEAPYAGQGPTGTGAGASASGASQ